MYFKKYYEEFMEIAMEEAKESLKDGNKGFGTIIIKDNKIIGKEIFEEPTETFIRLINPKLQFKRNYNSLRPYTEYCEEIIFLRDNL